VDGEAEAEAEDGAAAAAAEETVAAAAGAAEMRRGGGRGLADVVEDADAGGEEGRDADSGGGDASG
jgi:heterogeneous nuclear ribonucleoprotein A1/A3